MRSRKYSAAILSFNRALGIDPENAKACYGRGAYERAIKDFQAAKLLRPSSESYNLLTWMLAACPEPGFRNGPAAVQMVFR